MDLPRSTYRKTIAPFSWMAYLIHHFKAYIRYRTILKFTRRYLCFIFRCRGMLFLARQKALWLMTFFCVTIFYTFYWIEMVIAYREIIPFQQDLKLKIKDVYIKGELENYEKYLTMNENYSVDCKALNEHIDHIENDKNFVYVGVITSEKTVNTLGRAIHNTWGTEVDKIDFFVGNAPLTSCGCDHCSNMPIINLNVVSDEVYPPQQKSFRALEYICDNYLDKYKWFVRADDDGYFKFSNLRRLLRSLDENIPYYMGLPNPGSMRKYFYMKVWRHKYCDGSAVIYSRAALKALCPFLRRCSSHCLTHHEDVEVGRCVLNNVGLQCAQSTGEISMTQLFVHKDPTWGPVNFIGDPDKVSYVKKAIHLHKVTTPATMHNLHAYYLRTQQSIKEYCDKKK